MGSPIRPALRPRRLRRVTGKRVHEGRSIPELLREHQESSISRHSSIVEDMDPAVERVILHCLEREAHLRPPSARAVSAASSRPDERRPRRLVRSVDAGDDRVCADRCRTGLLHEHAVGTNDASRAAVGVRSLPRQSLHMRDQVRIDRRIAWSADETRGDLKVSYQ